jgi:hypothetical protein
MEYIRLDGKFTEKQTTRPLMVAQAQNMDTVREKMIYYHNNNIIRTYMISADDVQVIVPKDGLSEVIDFLLRQGFVHSVVTSRLNPAGLLEKSMEDSERNQN